MLRRPSVIIATLGFTQIFAWGSSYYLLTVMAAPIAAETGWPLPWVVAGISAALLTSGLAAPRVGQTINRYGGRPVLVVSAILFAVGLVMLGLSRGQIAYFSAWIVIGLGMSAGLYDAAFGTLVRYFGQNARNAISIMTLVGGFASTVSWPSLAYLVAHLGWRNTCLLFAVLQIGVILPIYLVMLPRLPDVAGQQTKPGKPASHAVRLDRSEWLPFILIACITTVSLFLISLMSLNLLVLLQARGHDLATAISLGMLLGPAQVGARIFEIAFGRRYHPIWIMLTAVGFIAIAMILLTLNLPFTAGALIVYAIGAGIFPIARGALPLVLFGADRYAPLMGRIAMPGLMMQAFAPSVGALVFEYAGADGAFLFLAALATANIVFALFLWRAVTRHPTAQLPP